MKSAIHDASARQHSGGPSPVAGRGGNRHERARKPVLSEIEAEIAGLLDRSTPELRLAWLEFRRAGPPLGLSRDLLIRALAYELQEHAHGGPSLALSRLAHRGSRRSWQNRRASGSAGRSCRRPRYRPALPRCRRAAVAAPADPSSRRRTRRHRNPRAGTPNLLGAGW